jgi:hypothetical protein
MSSNRRLKQSRTRDDEKGARNGPLDREEEQESAGRGAQSGARARCPVVPKIKFATDSSLEGGVSCELVSEKENSERRQIGRSTRIGNDSRCRRAPFPCCKPENGGFSSDRRRARLRPLNLCCNRLFRKLRH